MNSFGNIDFYLFYKKSFNGKLQREGFYKILSLFFLKVKRELYAGRLIKLPYGLGSYFIEKYKPKLKQNDKGEYYVASCKAVDFKATKALWAERPDLKAKKQRVFYENKHTDGYQYKLSRTKFRSGFLQKIYNFKPAEGFSTDLAQVLFKDPYREFITS